MTTAAPARHSFKSSYGQCECRLCGKRYGDCVVTTEIREALRVFVKANGRTWKAKLRSEWQTGGYNLGDQQQPLMLLRNIISPAQLNKIPTKLLS